MASTALGQYQRRLVELLWPSTPKDKDEPSPIWCLGRDYAFKKRVSCAGDDASDDSAPQAPVSNDSTVSSDVDVNGEGRWPVPFLDDFEARFWLTYRSDFETILRSQDANADSAMSLGMRVRNTLSNQNGFSSDIGWGCMIRTGQSVLANALQVLHLGRDWRRGQDPEREKWILSLFADSPTAPFSIHRFVEHGAASCGKYPGEWFGPSAAASCIKALAHSHADARLRIYVTGNNEDVLETAFMETATQETGYFQPTLVLICTMLGTRSVTSGFWGHLAALMRMPQSLGIAGGKPSSSLYFVGLQGLQLLHIDPHHTQSCLPHRARVSDYTKEEVDSCHTRVVGRLHMQDLDPSMMIAFLIRDEADWQAWKKGVAGNPAIRMHDSESGMDSGHEREGAIDEVETLDDEDGLQ